MSRLDIKINHYFKITFKKGKLYEEENYMLEMPRGIMGKGLIEE